MIIAWLLSLHLLLLYTSLIIYVERKTAAFIQNRLGPYEVGPYGLLQPVADVLKLLQKEDLCPGTGHRGLFRIAPLIPFLAVLCAFSCIPLFPGIVFLQAPVGVLLVLALLALDVLGILLAGWSSGSKFSMYGAFRALTQLIAYEVPLGFALVAVVLLTQSMDFVVIAKNQHIGQWGGGVFDWNIFRFPILIPVFAIFFICALAKGHRTPFDLPEAESELVAGYHTEYSGFRWSLFMMAEYGIMFVMSLLMIWMFFGAGHSPLPNLGGFKGSDWTNDTISGEIGWWSFFWIINKTLGMVWIQIWIRWSLPRFRMDQLLHFCWKYLTPASIILVYSVALLTFL